MRPAIVDLQSCRRQFAQLSLPPLRNFFEQRRGAAFTDSFGQHDAFGVFAFGARQIPKQERNETMEKWVQARRSP